MMYCGSAFVERIGFCTDGDAKNMHYIEMCKYDGMFTVSFCCSEDWDYSFYMDSQSDYERVKFNIMDAIFECDTIEELLHELSDVFEDGFSDILIEDECDRNCGNCNETNNYLN